MFEQENAEPLPKYAFISYFSDQVDVNNEKVRGLRYHLLYALAVKYTKAHECKAFWIAADCQPSRRSEATDDEHFQRLTNEDVSHEAERDWHPVIAILFQNSNIWQVYTMSDVIREACRTIVITLGPREAHPTVAVKEWGERVWTLPEILLGKSHEIILLQCGLQCELEEVEIDVKEGIFSKIQLAPFAWGDAPKARQLVDHFNGFSLSRLELLDIALDCFKVRKLKTKYRGDHIYAMMGLLRVRPLIDTGDSAFQAFARYVNTENP